MTEQTEIQFTGMQKWIGGIIATVLGAGAIGSFATAIQVRDLARSNKQRLDAIESDMVDLENVRNVLDQVLDRRLQPIQSDIHEVKMKVERLEHR